jgi:hypothetical protein
MDGTASLGTFVRVCSRSRASFGSGRQPALAGWEVAVPADQCGLAVALNAVLNFIVGYVLVQDERNDPPEREIAQWMGLISLDLGGARAAHAARPGDADSERAAAAWLACAAAGRVARPAGLRASRPCRADRASARAHGQCADVPARVAAGDPDRVRDRRARPASYAPADSWACPTTPPENPGAAPPPKPPRQAAAGTRGSTSRWPSQRPIQPPLIPRRTTEDSRAGATSCSPSTTATRAGRSPRSRTYSTAHPPPSAATCTTPPAPKRRHARPPALRPGADGKRRTPGVEHAPRQGPR